MNPFGVQHEPMSKSFNKTGAKLLTSLERSPHPGTTMEQRVRWNYAHWRGAAGDTGLNAGRFGKPGASSIASAQRAKEGSRAMVTAAGNINRRKKKVLP
jgi:hypothetical protein